VLRRRDRRDRIELEEAEPPNGLEHVRRGAVEELSVDGGAARLSLGECSRFYAGCKTSTTRVSALSR
jgi:hypothetical protein